jgi:hypothetical protein
VLVVGADSQDDLDNARAAVEYWNRQFEALGTSFRLGPVTRAERGVTSGEVMAMSADVVNRVRPAITESVRNMPGDLIVFFSGADFISFAARWPAENKALVGIKARTLYPLSLPNVPRNLIAHELGHAIGLGHNADPTKLMCGPPARCRPDEFSLRTERFFPLTDEEQAALRRLYPPDWAPR